MDRRPCLTGGAKRLSICYSGREPTRKDFLPVRKSPFTNTAKSPLFCSPKVNISLYLMESLQNWGLLGKNCINSGLYWGSEAGIYYANLGGVRGSRWMGMRSRAPPVADAARRSIRSGRKNRASEQREDFFGHRKAAGTAIGRGVRRRKSRCRV